MPQDVKAATLARKVSSDDVQIPWSSHTATHIHRLHRAFAHQVRENVLLWVECSVDFPHPSFRYGLLITVDAFRYSPQIPPRLSSTADTPLSQEMRSSIGIRAISMYRALIIPS